MEGPFGTAQLSRTPEIVMQAGCVVLLYDENAGFAGLAWP
jgi:hypothetical protein